MISGGPVCEVPEVPVGSDGKARHLYGSQGVTLTFNPAPRIALFVGWFVRFYPIQLSAYGMK